MVSVQMVRILISSLLAIACLSCHSSSKKYLTSSSCLKEIVTSSGFVGKICDRACWLGKYFKSFSAISLEDSSICIGCPGVPVQKFFVTKWFSGCLPCIKEIPELLELQENHPKIKFVSFCRDDVRKEYGIISRHNYDTEHWIINPTVQDSIFGACGYPTSFLFDHTGKIDTALAAVSYDLNFDAIDLYLSKF